MTAPNSDGTAAAQRPRLVMIVSAIRTSPGHFRATLASTNELLVGSSRQPFVDSARVLIEKGIDGNTILVMKHSGSDIVALKAPLWKAAKLTVEEGPHGPRFVSFRKGPRTSVAAPSIAPSAAGATHPPETDSLMGGPATRHLSEGR